MLRPTGLIVVPLWDYLIGFIVVPFGACVPVHWAGLKILSFRVLGIWGLETGI